MRFDATTKWTSGGSTVYGGRQPLHGDIRGKFMEVYMDERMVAAGVVIAAGGYPGGSGPHIRANQMIGIVLDDERIKA